jgi:hypothetical protein
MHFGNFFNSTHKSGLVANCGKALRALLLDLKFAFFRRTPSEGSDNEGSDDGMYLGNFFNSTFESTLVAN